MDFQLGLLRILDQRLLPSTQVWLECRDVESVAQAIEGMAIRGAPAIGCAAAFALAVSTHTRAEEGGLWSDYAAIFAADCERLARTRPTAVNLFHCLERMRRHVSAAPAGASLSTLAKGIDELARRLYADDLATCRAIGEHGARLAAGRRLRILTHCNTGSLATAGYGTALGVIRALHESGQIEMVYADETRPYLQGGTLDGD